MTRADKPVTRLTYARYRGVEIVVTLQRTSIALRLKGTRKTFLLDVEAAYCRAAHAEAMRAVAERQAQRRQRRPR